MTRPHLGAKAMTSPNDVAALVERARKAQKIAPGPWEAEAEETESGWGKHDEFVILNATGIRMCGTENANAEFGSISEEHDDEGGHWQWNEHSRVLMHFIAACDPTTILGLAEAVATQAATIAALQAEVERAKEEMSNVIIQAGCLRHYSRKPDGMPTIGEIQAGHFEDMAVRAFPSLATLLGREQTARSASRKETTP